MNPSAFLSLQDYNDGNMTSDSDTGYATSNTDMQQDNQSNTFDHMSLDELFQSSEPLAEAYPSDHYNPSVGWYEPAAAYGPGACFNRAIGWYIPMGGAAPPAAQASAFNSVIPSGFNTPQEMQPQYPQLAAGTFPPQSMPQAPMIPQGPMHVPTIARPHHRQVVPSGYFDTAAQPANNIMQRSQTPRPRPAPAPAAATASRRGPRPQIKKMSLDRACTCKARPAKIRRPPNSFILYRMQSRHQLARELSTQDNAEISKEAGVRWKALPEAEKAKYKVQADEIALQHKEEHPDYRYVANSKHAFDFGDETCTCGAYEANQAYRERRDAENLAQARAARRAPGKSAARDTQAPIFAQSQLFDEPEQLPEYDPELFSDMPASRPASSMKRKRPATSMDIDTSTPKRQTRQSSKVPNYVDPDETDEDNITLTHGPTSRKSPRTNKSASMSTIHNDSLEQPLSTANSLFDADADFEIDPDYDLTQFDDYMQNFIDNNAYEDIQPSRRTSSKKSSSDDGRKSSKTSNTSSRATPTRRSARIAVQ